MTEPADKSIIVRMMRVVEPAVHEGSSQCATAR